VPRFPGIRCVIVEALRARPAHHAAACWSVWKGSVPVTVVDDTRDPIVAQAGHGGQAELGRDDGDPGTNRTYGTYEGLGNHGRSKATEARETRKVQETLEARGSAAGGPSSSAISTARRSSLALARRAISAAATGF